MAKALGALWSSASLDSPLPGFRNSFGTGIKTKFLEAIKFVKYGVHIGYGTVSTEIRIDTLISATPAGGGGGDSVGRSENSGDYKFGLRVSDASAGQNTLSNSTFALIIERNLDRFAYWMAFVLSEDTNSRLTLSYCGCAITISAMVAGQDNSENDRIVAPELASYDVGSIGDRLSSSILDDFVKRPPATNNSPYYIPFVDVVSGALLAPKTFADGEPFSQGPMLNLSRYSVSCQKPTVRVVKCVGTIFVPKVEHDEPSVDVSGTQLSPTPLSIAEHGSVRRWAHLLRQRMARSLHPIADLVTRSRSIMVLSARRGEPSVDVSGTRFSPATFADAERRFIRMPAIELLRRRTRCLDLAVDVVMRKRSIFERKVEHDEPSVDVSGARLSPATFADAEFGFDRMPAIELLRWRARCLDLAVDVVTRRRSIFVPKVEHDEPSVDVSGARLSPATFADAEFGFDRMPAIELLRWRARCLDLAVDVVTRRRSIFVPKVEHDEPSVDVSGTRLSPATFADVERGFDRMPAIELLRWRARCLDLAVDVVTRRRSIFVPKVEHDEPSVDVSGTRLSPATFADVERGFTRIPAIELLRRQLFVPPSRTAVYGTGSAISLESTINKAGELKANGGALSKPDKPGAVISA